VVHTVELATNRKAQRQKKGKSSEGKISDNANIVLVSKQQRKHITQANPADLVDSEGTIIRSKKGISKPNVLEPWLSRECLLLLLCKRVSAGKRRIGCNKLIVQLQLEFKLWLKFCFDLV